MYAAARTAESTKTKKVLPIPVTAPAACTPYGSELDQGEQGIASSSVFAHEQSGQPC